jgi:hypothetical protein
MKEFDDLPPSSWGRWNLMWKDISNKVFDKPEVIEIMKHTTHHDGCDCVMNKIKKLESENARLKEALEMAETYVSSYEFNNEEEYTFIMNQIREALKGGE